jgi:hypothetical protein
LTKKEAAAAPPPPAAFQWQGVRGDLESVALVLYYHWVGGGIGALEDAAAVFAQKACPLVHGRNPYKLWVNHRQISRIWRTRAEQDAAPHAASFPAGKHNPSNKQQQ